MFSAPTSDLEARMQSRQRSFMQVPDFAELKKKRDEHEQELRRAKRSEVASKRRNLTVAQFALNESSSQKFSLTDLPKVREMASHDIDSDRLFSATAIRKILSLPVDAPIQEIVDAGLVPVLMDWLKRGDFPILQYESCWALTNIASGSHDHASALVTKGVIPLLYALLKANSEDVCEQAVWLLGNIAGDSAELRDAVLQSGGMQALLEVFGRWTKESLVKVAAWTLSNACRGTPNPPISLVKPALPTLCNLILTLTDSETLKDCLWAVSSMCEGNVECTQLMISTGILPRIVSLSSAKESKVQLPALRCLGNAVSGSENATQAVIDAGFIPRIKELLHSSKSAIRKEAAWLVSNLAAGTQTQVQTMVQNEVLKTVLTVLPREAPVVQKELLYCLQNAALTEALEVPLYLLQAGALAAIGETLDSPSARIVHTALDVLRALLEVGKRHFSASGVNRVASELDSLGLLSKIEQLQSHDNQQIYRKAVSLLTNYFEAEQPTDDLTASILAISHFQL